MSSSWPTMPISVAAQGSRAAIRRQIAFGYGIDCGGAPTQDRAWRRCRTCSDRRSGIRSVNHFCRCSEEPCVHDSGLTRPVACFWIRSSPTDDAADSASAMSLSLNGSRNGHVGALLLGDRRVVRPDARHSSRPAVRCARRCRWRPAAPCCARPSVPCRFCTWWPNSWATTYSCANGPPLEPNWSTQHLEEVGVEVGGLVDRAVERPDVAGGRAAAGVDGAAEQLAPAAGCSRAAAAPTPRRRSCRSRPRGTARCCWRPRRSCTGSGRSRAPRRPGSHTAPGPAGSPSSGSTPRNSATTTMSRPPTPPPIAMPRPGPRPPPLVDVVLVSICIPSLKVMRCHRY